MATDVLLGGTWIGQAAPRREGLELLAGKARYLADVFLPRMLHAAFRRSPHAHARIRAFDARGALAMRIGTAPAGFAVALLAVDQLHLYHPAMVAGRGWIAIAGGGGLGGASWRPWGCPS